MERVPLGFYVSERRKALSFVQGDLADRLGYSVQAISKFESGESQISLSVIPALCNMLDESIDDFFARNPNPKHPLEPAKAFDPRLLSANLAVYRVNHGLTLVIEAQALGISKNALIAYEKGSSLPPLDLLDRFFAYSSLAPSEFLYVRIPGALSERTSRKKAWLIGIASALSLIVLSVSSFIVYISTRGFGHAQEPSGTTGQTGSSAVPGEGDSSGSSSPEDSSGDSSSAAASPFESDF
jgi:transcriptional regulator with XRE-family HTH domain